MTNKALSIFNQLRPNSRIPQCQLDHSSMSDDGSHENAPLLQTSTYNIVKTGEYTYDVELALAGFSKDDIQVHYENNMLTVNQAEG